MPVVGLPGARAREFEGFGTTGRPQGAENEVITMELSKRIRDLRYAKGWGPDELASRAKISRTALYQIERGNTSKPQAGTLRRISKALGVPLEVLLDMEPLTHHEGPSAELGGIVTPAPMAGSPLAVRMPSADRAEELLEKFRLLLASPLAEGVARIVEESFRLLPIIPPPSVGDTSSYAPANEIEPARRGRSSRSRTTV
jgi:transcriptional regulator with XRE-family HTH domain